MWYYVTAEPLRDATRHSFYASTYLERTRASSLNVMTLEALSVASRPSFFSACFRPVPKVGKKAAQPAVYGIIAPRVDLYQTPSGAIIGE